MVNPSTRLRMNVILCGFGLAAPGVFRYLLGQVDNLAVFTHDDLAHAPGLTRQAQTAGVWHRPIALTLLVSRLSLIWSSASTTGTLSSGTLLRLAGGGYSTRTRHYCHGTGAARLSRGR